MTAVSGIVGGLALFADLSLHAFGSLDRAYYVVATAMAVALLGVPAAIWLAGAVSGTWRMVLAVAGTALVVLGSVGWIAAFLVLFNDPDEAFSQRLTPGGSGLMALGMLLVGLAVLRSRVLTGFRRVGPLAVGLYFPAQLVVQVAFFLDGKDSDPGPNGAILGIWGLLWALTSWSTLAAEVARTRS